MESKEKKLRCTALQKRMLVDFMSTHTYFAVGEYTGPLGGKKHEAEWQSLKRLLKEHGPDKSVAAWKAMNSSQKCL